MAHFLLSFYMKITQLTYELLEILIPFHNHKLFCYSHNSFPHYSDTLFVLEICLMSNLITIFSEMIFMICKKN